MSKTTLTIDKSIQAIVDDQLLNHGFFSSLDFLLTSGRVSSSAYAAWRSCEVEYLDETLSGSIPKIISLLRQACDYADRLGLSRKKVQLMSWSQPNITETKELQFSRNNELEALLACQFEAKNRHPQQDLFINNPVIAAVNNLVAAIIVRNLNDAEACISELYLRAPDHKDLAGYDLLVHSLSMIQKPAIGDMSELQLIENRLVATALELLGDQKNDFINSLWHWLANATVDRAYNPQFPKLHASYLLAQAGDWSSVRQIIETEGNYTAVPEIGFRLAKALHFLGERSSQIEVCCRMCWAFPTETEDYFSSEAFRDSSIKQLWMDYLSMEDIYDFSEPLECGSFPSWILIHEPGIIHTLPQDMLLGKTNHQITFKLAHNLIMARLKHKQEIEHRRALGHQHPILLKYYLDNIDTS
ncbi:MAG: hypothetical protein QGD92_02145 [Gammaproteobacteria bacterium]|nr:hypothetical protein [Gammaproteobacteria bacterium]